MKILKHLLYGCCLALSTVAATNTNLGPNGHQQFYTNWTTQYFAVRRVMETNHIQLSRYSLLMSRMPMYYPRTRGDQKEVFTREYASARKTYDAMQAGMDAERRKLKVIIDRRLNYELRFPAAVQYSPRIPFWTEPKFDSKMKE